MTPQRNSIQNLQTLYTLVVGLGLGYAVLEIVDVKLTPIPLNMSLVPFFLAYMVTLVPFYHGALRHLDATYIEQEGREVRSGALMVDFLLLFIEGCLFIALAALLSDARFFSWGLVALLSVDVVWGFGAHIAFTPSKAEKKETAWAVINLVTVIVLVGVLVFAEEAIEESARIERTLSVIVPLLALLS